MAIVLTQNNDIYRVQIALSALPLADGETVLVERSTNQLHYQTVRGGTALPILSGAASLDDFEYTDLTENWYRITPTSPGLVLDGTSGAYASTPDHSSLDITADVVLTWYGKLTDWESGTQTLVSKWDEPSDQRSYFVQVRAGGVVRMAWSADGTVATTLTQTTADSVTPNADGTLAVRAFLNVDTGAAEHLVEIHTSPTGEDGTWTQLGPQLVGSGATSVHAGTAPLEVGSLNGGADNNVDGVTFAASVFAGDIVNGNHGTGTLVANPDFAAQSMSAGSFTDSTGKLWTVNGTAFIAGTEENSIIPDNGGEVIFKSVRHPFLNMELPRVLRRDPTIGRRSRSQEFPVSGRSVGVAVSDVRLGRQFTLSVLAESLDDPLTFAMHLDMAIISGDVFFIHVPGGTGPNRIVPGGYVILADTAQTLLTGGPDSPQEFTLPCTVVAQPPPEVVGGTMTYGALEDFYGGYNNVLAANPAYAGLLQLMASRDALVVI